MLTEDATHWQTSYRDDRTAMGSRLLSAASGSSSLGKIVQLSSAAVIILEHSFYIFEKRRYPRDKPDSVPSCLVALEQYMASPHAVAVREAVGAAVQAFEEAVTAATHAYEEAMRIPAWIAKLPFERFQRKVKEAFERSKEREKEYLCSQAKARLIKTILEITLNHRLPRP
ncbi:hypothetical protein DFJ58DRAFT_294615 [Suillus subalutaceus]|uniref:uncharacterized protein n=1 Tax=Suillus subalutaceus TaxID=48586 RepID=UPI001B85EB46|nr:uncharacterized protein DFJ58DRAFT_294615 [Suillus subalutaceus]KAG1858735.1 hypothetical protein DFJ58DRAFT_294615 [Suillus subalutaceus]